MDQPFEYTARGKEPIALDSPARHPVPPRPEKTASELRKETLDQLENWFAEQADQHADNRREQLLDCDFYDHEQYDEKTRRVLEARGQQPATYNLIAPVVNWITGTERRTRVDWKVLPRGPEDLPLAEVKEHALKFVSDASRAGFERSRAFKDAVICGVGWMREFAQADPQDGPPVLTSYMDWKGIRWDGYSKHNDLRDSRSISIERYVDLDYAIAQFPDHAEALRHATQNYIEPAFELVQDDHLLPMAFHGTRSLQFGLASTGMLGRRSRHRVRMVETEYRRVVASKRVLALTDDYAELTGTMFDPTDGEMADLIARQRVTLEDKPVEQVWLAIWTPGTLLMDMASPYAHNKFSLTPMWCYRRHRDGMPYGVVRGLRDAQEGFNKRKSKALFAISTNRVKYEEDAFMEGDEDEMLDQAARPDGQIRLRAGALSAGKFELEGNQEVATGHVALMEQDARHIFEASGTTRENLGLDSDAKSGRAILAKQQQGAVSTAEIFDNLRLSIQISGEKILSLTEQYMSKPMHMRILGSNGEPDWMAINQPHYDPVSGEVYWDNDITKGHADFVVDQQDYRETVRMAMAEMLMETIQGLPPEVGLQLLDLAIEMTDLPNRDKFVARIRAITGAGEPAPEPTPEEQAAQEHARQLEQRAASADIEGKEARAARDRAAATRESQRARLDLIKGRGEALNVAQALEAALPLAPTADRLAEFPPEPGNV